uniref:Uncharacterized protein n=1 Tax=Nelumbo nucifera TaxID=4432 RepID=A0A822Z5V2_NELNU|nr:TPA_asm: hypothetical protein HUJ06_014775 [Nelumbo nucifera]
MGFIAKHGKTLIRIFFFLTDGGSVMKELDINQIPSGTEEVGSAEEDTSLGGGGGEGPHRKKLCLTKEQSRLLGEFQTEPNMNPVSHSFVNDNPLLLSSSMQL